MPHVVLPDGRTYQQHALVAVPVVDTITSIDLVAGATAVVVAAANTNRKTLTLVNVGSNDAHYGYSSGVTDANGMPLYAGGGGFGWSLGEADTRAVYAYSVSGTTLRIKEGV